MNINQFNTTDACNVPTRLSLKDPFSEEVIKDEAGKPLDVFVYGMQSDVFRNAKKARDRKYGKEDKLDEEQAELAGAEMLAAITQGWSGNWEEDGEPLAYNKANAIRIYIEQDWIAKQVLTHACQLRNYDPKRLKGSGSGSGSSAGSTRSQKGKKKVEENS
jgi:hypothetical protein